MRMDAGAPPIRKRQSPDKHTSMLRRRLGLWLITLLIAACGSLLPRQTAAHGMAFDAAIPLARCTALHGASLPTKIRRPGVAARRCFIRPALRFFVLSSDPTSWPAVQEGSGP